jgi:hypothetical protein
MTTRRHLRPPADCPVCADRLHITRLSCDGCGTELTGDFPPSEFAALAPDELEVLRVFLRSRGNMKELERHLGVSYPTARARFDAVLHRLGITPTGGAPAAERPPDPAKLDLLQRLANGEVDIDAAVSELGT